MKSDGTKLSPEQFEQFLEALNDLCKWHGVRLGAADNGFILASAAYNCYAYNVYNGDDPSSIPE